MNLFVRKILGPASFPLKDSQDLAIPEVAITAEVIPEKFSGVVEGKPVKPTKPGKPEVPTNP